MTGIDKLDEDGLAFRYVARGRTQVNSRPASLILVFAAACMAGCDHQADAPVDAAAPQPAISTPNPQLIAGTRAIHSEDKPEHSALDVLEKEVCGESFAVTGTGAVWTIAPEGPPRFHDGQRVSATQTLHLGYDEDLEPITRPPANNQITFFDRGEWQVVPWTERLNRRDRNGPNGRIVAGIDNTVLVIGDEKALLIQGTEVVGHGELVDLIREHRDLICRSFGPGAPHPIRRDNWNRHTMIAADERGRIWCLHDEHLRVLIDDVWLDCREPLVKAGDRNGAIAFFVPGPGHRFLYIGDQSLRHDGGMSFLAKIEDGRLALTPTHHAIEGMSRYPAVREQNDAIWIGSPDGRAGSRSDHFYGQSAVRIDRNGEESHVLKMSGYPVLWDPIGNMWLGRIRGSSDDLFNIVRDGVVIQQLDIPGQIDTIHPSSEFMPLFCDRPGSVYVYTASGLQHVVADEAAPHRYRVGRRYSLNKSKGTPRAYSSQGYCISLVAGQRVPLKWMYLATLP